MGDVSFEIVQTMVRKAFDPETISVTVGRVEGTLHRIKVVVRDELSKLSHTFHVSETHTIAEIEGFINHAGEKLGLVKGPDKIGNETVAVVASGNGDALDVGKSEEGQNHD